MYVGSKKQKFDVIFDTGSNWFWVQSKECENCPGKDSFDENASVTFKFDDTEDIQTLQYGSGAVAGAVCTDIVCLSKENDEHCVSNFHFLDVLK